MGEIDNLKFPSPSLQEKWGISNFLDHETAKIDQLIAKQEKLIGLLKEKRQAVISHAVTKGLNPDVKMKDSGVEWLGEVPEHWDLTHICRLCYFMGGGTPSKNNPDFWTGDIPWVSPKDMKVSYISDAEDHINEDAVTFSSTKKIPQNSVLIVVRGMILAHSVPVALTTKIVTINQDMKALIPHGQILSEYLLLCLQGLKSPLLSLVDDSAHGTKCLRTELFEKMNIPLPGVDEQQEIIAVVKYKLRVMDVLLRKEDKFIFLLKERRSALISAAVTGKIDVRDWQSKDIA